MKKIFLTLVLIASLGSSAFASVTIINGLTHMYNGNSGDVIEGEVVLINGSDIEQRVKFSINEAIFSCGANRIFTEKNPHLQSSSEWIDSGITERLLLPRERYVHKFKIRIPKDQSLKGSFWSVMMVYVERPIKEEMLNNSIGLNTKIRYAVGLLTNVNGYDQPNLDFEQVQLEDKTGKKALGIKMKNDGAFIEGVKLSLEVYDANGNKVKVLETDRNLVFPGVCKDYIIDISDLPKGEYQCLLLAEARKEYVGTNISLTQK